MRLIRLYLITLILLILTGCVAQQVAIPTRFTLEQATGVTEENSPLPDNTSTLVPVQEQNLLGDVSSLTPVQQIITPTQPPTKTPSPTWTASQTPLPTETAFATSMIIPVQPSATAFVQQPTTVQNILPTVNTCAYEWGFGGYTFPGCPAAPMRIDNAAYQSFYMAESGARGHMIWIESTLKIYVLYDDNKPNAPAWEIFDDTYCGPGCDPECEPGLDISPYRPPGQFQPCRGFGKVWRNKANDPWWRLGWSDMPNEVGDVIRIQPAIDGTLYLGVFGRIFGLAPNGTSWTRYR